MTTLTLSVDEQVLEDATRTALARKMPLSALVREFLCELAAAQKREKAVSVDELERSFQQYAVNAGPHAWTRDELHERR